MLTHSEITHYQEQGYVIPDFRLSPDAINEIAKRHSTFIDKHSEFSDYCPALLAYDKWFLTIAKTPDILDMVEQLIGPDFALWNSSFFAKPAKVGSKTPWHQDGEYWPIEPLATCTVWIAIDSSTEENGCLRVIPGSHKSKSLTRHEENTAAGLALNLELQADQFSENDASELVLEAGQISLHDVFLYHGSEPNRSLHSRRGLTLRYMPTTSVYCHDKPPREGRPKPTHMSQRTLYLMRGIDCSNSNDFNQRF